jgi:predicted kinase
MKTIKKVILTRGIPGSGKSTWAKAWVAEDPENRVRFNWDDMRKMMGPYWVPSREHVNAHLLFAGLHAVSHVDEPYDVVIDNMNLNPKSCKSIVEWVSLFNNSEQSNKSNTMYTVEYKDFFIPLEECIRRDAQRKEPVGEQTIRKIWNSYKHFIQTTNVENYVNNLRAWDIGKPTCVVVDMDSTLCFNTTKRPWFGEGATEGMINDVPNGGVCDVVIELQKTYPIIIATGRDTTQVDVTKQWLSDHGINPKDYYFRTKGDRRKGVEVKREQIEKIMEKYNILVVFEDCEPIVEMYRELGLTVLQPNKGL